MSSRWKSVFAAVPALVAVASFTAPVHAQTVPTTIDAAGLKKQVAARKGKVVVVNFWATWCGPCVEEYPSLIALQKKYAAKGLELITISCDESADVKPKVVPFLAKHKQTKGAFVNKAGSELTEDYLAYLEPKLSPDDAAAIPRTYIFGRDGKLKKVITGGQSLAQFQKAVEPYLK